MPELPIHRIVRHLRRLSLLSNVFMSVVLQDIAACQHVIRVLLESETDLWKAGKTTYQVEKHFKGTDIPYEDGTHVLYVNAAVDDGTEIAKLMKLYNSPTGNHWRKSIFL